MTITASAFTLGHLQVDGRRRVTETHTDHLGQVYTIEYGPTGPVDYNAIMVARAVQLETQLAEAEAEKLLAT